MVTTAKKRLRVLFIDEFLPQEMLGVMWLSRAIKDAGHDTRALFVPDRDWITKLKEYNPDVVCFSVTTGMHQYMAEINQRVKRELPGVLSVFGGPHPTFTPEYIELDGIDVICRGEGEVAVVELLDRVAAGQDIKDVANMWVKDRATGEIHKNPVRPLVRDLDSLGFPDRDVVYDAAPIYGDSDRKVFVTQRGCPMNCSFCFHHAWKKKVYNSNNKEYTRKRSVDHVIAELKAVKAKYNLKFVHFVDDIFNLKNDWLAEFCERYPKEVGLPFDVILMANLTTEKHIELLKKAGCVYARIAIEAANDHVRNAIFRKNTTRQQLIDAAGWISKHGIRLGSLNILGAPGATVEDELDTVRLNVECKVDHPMVSLMQPYPMFDITQTTEQMGYTVSSLDQFPVNFRRSLPVEFESRRQIENLHKLFPIAVRNPWLVKYLPTLIKPKWMYRPYLVLFMLHAQYLVSEQAGLYAHAQGLSGPRYWTWVDFVYRLFVNGGLRLYQVLFKQFQGRFAAKAKDIQVRLQMGDERVVAHMD
ncbi:MAG: B12-binding domain-containing radical SAM protein [Planctomycetes bacterium]|nr:B12-binding domain-containing radical SAM protein [Planctomycetota bacterium]